MIVGLGVDVVEIVRIRRTMERFGKRFSERILSAEELRHGGHARDPARSMARFFAVKEATAKALGTGFAQQVAPRQISLYHHTSGQPAIRLSGAARNRFQYLEGQRCHVSLTHDAGVVVAVVIIES